jgi:hypothetical protein
MDGQLVRGDPFLADGLGQELLGQCGALPIGRSQPTT